MALSITLTGRPIVAGEKDRVLTFEDLGIDWAGAGYSLKLQITSPDTTCTIVNLSAVGGHTDWARLTGTDGLFPTSGVYTLKLLAREGSSTANELASVDYRLYVFP